MKQKRLKEKMIRPETHTTDEHIENVLLKGTFCQNLYKKKMLCYESKLGLEG